MQENFATILETVAEQRADRTAVTRGAVSLTWQQLEERAARLAAFLASRGIGADDRVAIALYNGPEYLETLFAALKLRAVPVNVNYRYQAGEMAHVLADANAAAIVFDAALGARVTTAQRAVPSVRTLVQAGLPGADAAAAWRYEEVIAGHTPLPRTRRDVDHWLMYTGGTTGKPKGVLVDHAWLYPVISANGFRLIGEPVPDTLSDLRAATVRLSADRGDALVCLPAPPLMHATGMYTTLGALVASGRVVFLTGRSYDPGELAGTVAAQRVDTVSLVGDVFALPLADALDEAAAAGRPFDLSSLRAHPERRGHLECPGQAPAARARRLRLPGPGGGVRGRPVRDQRDQARRRRHHLPVHAGARRPRHRRGGPGCAARLRPGRHAGRARR